MEYVKNTDERINTRGPHPVHEGGGAPPVCGQSEAPPTSTPTLYIHVRGEKNQREGFIAFYDTEPPPSPKLSRKLDLESLLGSGEGNPSPSSSSTILHHEFHVLTACVSNSIIGLLDGDGLDEIYHVIELVLLGFDP